MKPRISSIFSSIVTKLSLSEAGCRPARRFHRGTHASPIAFARKLPRSLYRLLRYPEHRKSLLFGASINNRERERERERHATFLKESASCALACAFPSSFSLSTCFDLEEVPLQSRIILPPRVCKSDAIG